VSSGSWGCSLGNEDADGVTRIGHWVVFIGECVYDPAEDEVLPWSDYQRSRRCRATVALVEDR
jgi:hypothetical protein